MTESTPISQTKTAALTRVLDLVARGYVHYTMGVCPVAKATSLARKFHESYGIGITPAKRITRKRQDEANSLLVMYWPRDAQGEVHWLLLATPGKGAIWQQETLRDVTQTRLHWLGYEMVQHASRGKASWTWRRPKQAMAELYALIGEQLAHRHQAAVQETLERAAHQPGFAGVREQSWELAQFARSRGYGRELPHLFFVQKVAHGEPLVLS